MLTRTLYAVAISGAISVAISNECYAQQAAGPYTAAQSASGRAAYQANCAGCHGADLGGMNSASPLAGGVFMSTWGDRTTADLISFLKGSMPPTNPGGLGEQTYLAVTAFILDSTGARPGNEALPAAAKITIRSVATGQMPRTASAASGEQLGGRA